MGGGMAPTLTPKWGEDSKYVIFSFCRLEAENVKSHPNEIIKIINNILTSRSFREKVVRYMTLDEWLWMISHVPTFYATRSDTNEEVVIVKHKRKTCEFFVRDKTDKKRGIYTIHMSKLISHRREIVQAPRKHTTPVPKRADPVPKSKKGNAPTPTKLLIMPQSEPKEATRWFKLPKRITGRITRSNSGPIPMTRKKTSKSGTGRKRSKSNPGRIRRFLKGMFGGNKNRRLITLPETGTLQEAIPEIHRVEYSFNTMNSLTNTWLCLVAMIPLIFLFVLLFKRFCCPARPENSDKQLEQPSLNQVLVEQLVV